MLNTQAHSLIFCSGSIVLNAQMIPLIPRNEGSVFLPGHTLPEAEQLVQATGEMVAKVLAFGRSTIRQK